MSGRKFTGWHMTGILVAFFGVVVSVNVFMARAAISTFGGTVVDNSYVASQKFNGWLDKAEAHALARNKTGRGAVVAPAVAGFNEVDGRGMTIFGLAAHITHGLVQNNGDLFVLLAACEFVYLDAV